MKTFSVITPVFNGEKYIDKCIEAIIHANYPLSNIEHIIVNDGSTDRTKQICERYAKLYNHIKFYDKTNGNWGSVINYVKNNHLVKNDYVVICDADDQLLPQCFYIVNKKSENADLFVSSFYRWNGKNKKIKIIPYYFLRRKLNKKHSTQYYTPLICPQSGWIKKQIFDDLNDLNEGVSYQDTVLFADAQRKAKTIIFSLKPTCLYWCQRPGNSMTQSNSDNGLEKLINNFYQFEKNGWIEPFFYYTIGMKRIRKYLKKHKLIFDFHSKKPDYTGFPIYVRPILALMFYIFVKKYTKK